MARGWWFRQNWGMQMIFWRVVATSVALFILLQILSEIGWWEPMIFLPSPRLFPG